MDAQRWAIIESVYHAALGKEPSERSAYLAFACAEDPTLRSEIESLLGYADVQLCSPVESSKMTELLKKMGGAAVSHAAEPGAPAATGIRPALPVTIGRYWILRLLGEGGMGTVYEAQQENPRRRVALKVIRPGLASAELLRRFEQESQALGRLQHPGIAQIYEAGTADTGFGPQPYFAMEFIRGESLLEYAQAHELDTRQRLELMAKVCEAVHHAHQRGIIHRDLKPGNILVDESGQAKVLDFGVARVTDRDAKATRQTDVARLVGTLAYMSPEQVLADPLELDTRSDVYALGVILYELLASRLPYTVSHNLLEAVQTIREADPVPLNSINRHYRGDIETIVAKALEKDKARRYASAAGLADDIRRYLTDEPTAPEQRPAFLEQACSRDDTLRQEVESFMGSADEASTELLQSAALRLRLSKGTRLGDYEVQSLLGAGGMGEVFRARDTKLDREVAIKILPETFASNADRMARFQREAKVLASLNHPNIAQIYCIEERALVMELIEGPTLADRIKEGAVRLEEALAIARQVAGALEAAHEKGIVHRDLKPSNIT